MKDESVLERTCSNTDSIACFKMQEKATRETFNAVALAFSLAFWCSFMLMTWKNVALLALCVTLQVCMHEPMRTLYISVIFCK